MKIRIKDNSVRLRLTQTEVKMLSGQGRVEASTDFGHSKFTYRVILEENCGNLQATFSKGTVTLKVPKEWGMAWYENDVVGIDHAQALENGKMLNLLLEKDFTCLDNTLEDQSDNYPNPKLQAT